MSQTTERLLTPEQAAEFLAISTRQLRDLADAGYLAFVNIGLGERPTRRYLPTDLAAFVEARRVAPGASKQRTAATGPSTTFKLADFAALREELRRKRQQKRGNDE
ncbi:helix-turn-helix domain-containing protein [Sinorhizobium medicae]|nr:helix-turn-helix domain-containing protein [Sinorhizobium medicae]